MQARVYGSNTDLHGDSSWKTRDGDRPLVAVSRLLANSPSMFLLACLGSFVMPLWMTVHTGADENVKRWVSTNLWIVALILPLLYAITHAINVLKGVPSKLPLVLSLIGSCIVFISVGQFVLVKVYRYGNAFVANDCDAIPAKRELQNQWHRASAFYANCQASLGHADVHASRFHPVRIQACTGYAGNASKKENEAWAYFDYLEHTYSCSGWCNEGQSFWARDTTRDSCSKVVADVLLNKVQLCMTQIVFYSVAVLLLTSVGLILGGSLLRKFGLNW